MQMSAKELLNWIVKPTLETLEAQLPIKTAPGFAESLLLASAQEAMHRVKAQQYSNEEDYLGLFAISPKCHDRIWDEYLVQDPDLASCVRGLASQHEFLRNPHQELTSNMRYACAIAWMLYLWYLQNSKNSPDHYHCDENKLCLWKQAVLSETGRKGSDKQFLKALRNSREHAEKPSAQSVLRRPLALRLSG